MEVTRSNFNDLLPSIADKIHSSSFVAVDAEYTGIYSEDLTSSNTLFDSGPQRYQKARDTVSKFMTCQYGLAIFRKDGGFDNTYSVDAYKFYVFPVSFDSFAKREAFSCQISCINFLKRHKFDFNKFLKEGIPYLNKEKAEALRSYLKNNRHIMHTSEYIDETYFPFSADQKPYILDDETIEEIINNLAGFSKIIDVINDAEVPVVGHNFYTDLLLTHHLFVANLPDLYEDFKKSIMKQFPVIYDTKFLAHEVHHLRREMSLDDLVLSDTNLFALYSNSYSLCGMNMPVINLNSEANVYREALIAGRAKNLEKLDLPDAACHSADFDAIVTGCVFLNVCTMACKPQPVLEYQKGLPPTFSELLGKTECWQNRVNIPRAIISHIYLDGPDPHPHRPNWILVNSRNIGKLINPVQLKLELVKHGDLEVDAINDTEVIIACGSTHCHRRVWSDLRKKGFALKEKCVEQATGFLIPKWSKKYGLPIGIGGAAMLIFYLVRFLRRDVM